ncbi:MAG TPA: DUF4037 domain-containing protein [Rectinemataceae bacterium]|nr:DUF4037 domain-containing protein [Rectinemataceae bacterium]
MRRKVERLANDLATVLSSWPMVECVTLGEHSEEDILDPYFALVVDVYHRGSIPPPAERQAAFATAFGAPGAFESALHQPKDRFFVDGLPLRVEYKNAGFIDEFLDRGSDLVWILKNSGTYMFYRIQKGRTLFQRNDWIERVKGRIAEFPNEYWAALRAAFTAKMEHYLSDLGAAAARDDGFFYLESSAGFARSAAAAIFMANRRFEPSHRAFEDQLRHLERLPDDFSGRWETLLRSDLGISRSQKYEVAQLIARSIIKLA